MNQFLLGKKLGKKTLKTNCLWLVRRTKKMAFISVHGRITTIAELTITTISWTTHITIPHLSKNNQC